MTNEEAIKWIMSIKDKYIHGGDEAFDESRREALDMGIKALEAYDKILPLLDPDIDAELALEKIREVIYD